MASRAQQGGAAGGVKEVTESYSEQFESDSQFYSQSVNKIVKPPPPGAGGKKVSNKKRRAGRWESKPEAIRRGGSICSARISNQGPWRAGSSKVPILATQRTAQPIAELVWIRC